VARLPRNRLLRTALALGVLAAAVTAMIALKPGEARQEPVPTQAPALAPDPGAPVPAPVQAAPAQREPAQPPAQASPSGHGDDAVVRSADDVGTGVASARPLATPDWSAPVSLTFSSFKALRRQFRRQRDFTAEEIARLHGAAVSMRGALMPIDPVPKSGELKRFWLANPVVVMAGCVFCNPPTMADLMYVEADGAPLVVDRERLYRSVVYATLIGRFELGPGRSEDGVEYLFYMKMRERRE